MSEWIGKWVCCWIRCLICNYKHVSVHPACCNEEELECPNCGYMNSETFDPDETPDYLF